MTCHPYTEFKHEHSDRDWTCPHDSPSGLLLIQTRGLGSPIHQRRFVDSTMVECLFLNNPPACGPANKHKPSRNSAAVTVCLPWSWP